MKYFKQLGLLLLGSVLVVAVISVLSPKSAHALIATLVQVVNTAANPAVTQDVSKAASQIREVDCGLTAPGSLSGDCTLTLPNATSGGTFIVPNGMNFVITSITFEPLSPGPRVNLMGLTQSGASRGGFAVTNATVTVLQFPTSGIVVSPGSALEIRSDTSSAGLVHTVYRGYLTPN